MVRVPTAAPERTAIAGAEEHGKTGDHDGDHGQ
jgi:hypothetical protein